MASLQNRYLADNHEAREVYDSIKVHGESSLESTANQDRRSREESAPAAISIM